MWKLLEQAAKHASVNASGYVSSVQEKAHALAAVVQDEASTLLSNAMGAARPGPVDEILYEEVAAYEQFSSFFSAEDHTHEITRAVDEDADIRALHDAMVPLELSYGEFWCRYFFRQLQAELHEQTRPRQGVMDSRKTVEDIQDEDKVEVDALDGDDEHRPEDDDPLRRDEAGSEDQEGRWLLIAARDAERRAAAQWRQKARDLHHRVQELKQQYDEKERKALQEWETQLQTLCDTYESKMAAAMLQIDEARAKGYEESVCASQASIVSVRQKAEEDMARLRSEICEGIFDASVNGRVAVLMNENRELQRDLRTAREEIAGLEKRGGSLTENAGGTALAELTKEKDLWRTRALKMKKLKDLVQAELTTLRQQRSADAVACSGSPAPGTRSVESDDHSKLQNRMNELQNQLANALAESEARACRAYEKGLETGKADAEQGAEKERDVAYHEGYKKAQADAKSELGVLKAELRMFRVFHASAAHCADHVDGSAEVLLDNSLDDISLADGQALCSPTSSVSIFTDNGKCDSLCPDVLKATDDWGEW